ncbi:mannose-6-phosphate isomerase, class I [Planococcus salinarum]|uniref:mannose-6-phosphate isomerase, class I n=1 Tax=Planococcus salinarum TaxID=622695 RepID=UPI000E3E4D1C|nr:mannose-6-phosphate isomerase, class I [Planococcus salinarum]TAA72301.1 mannose-6-phosphate isomerase, class I [Planococcus salinarum]
MYNEPVFLEPFFQERIWGGEKLKALFNYDIPNHLTGEAWLISAHKNGPSIVKNGELQGKSLCEIWEDHPYLFGKESSGIEFPLLIKLLDANDRLSVQVHPDDTYAREVAGEPCGKTECWYILDCEEGAEVIIGHKAQSKEEFQVMVEKGDWQGLFHSIKVKKGDFIYVPSGTLHAIGKGIVILETQQSSDITFRVYDYDRTDDKGQKRQLHLEEAITVTTCPHRNIVQDKVENKRENLVATRLIKEEYFTVYHWVIAGRVETPLSTGFLMVSVIEGSGEFVTEETASQIKKGDNFIVPATIGQYFIKGHLELIVSHT